MVSMVGDYCSTEDANKMKSNKRKAFSKVEESNCIDSEKQGDVANPSILVQCSSSSSSSLTMKKLCFWGKDDLNGNINWYVVNIHIKPKQKLTKEIKKLSAFNHNCLHSHIENKQTCTLTPVFSFPDQNSLIPLFGNTFATLGSFVYSVGGIYDDPDESIGRQRHHKNSKICGSDLVYYFDTSCRYVNPCWKQAPSMISNRHRPQVIALCGKLYVFGCFGREKCPHKPRCVWAEFFDPSTGQWNSLPVPKFKECLMVFTPNHTKLNQIAEKILVLADHKRIHKFDIENNCWTLIAEFTHNLGNFIRKPPVLVDNVLYWFDYNANAYDILKGETFEGPVQDFSFQHSMRFPPFKIYNPDEDEEEEDYNGCSSFTPAIIHLGGRYFCLLASLPNLEEAKPNCIHCLVIKVSQTNHCFEQYSWTRRDIERFLLRARVVSCQSFPIDSKMEFIDGQMMMI